MKDKAALQASLRRNVGDILPYIEITEFKPKDMVRVELSATKDETGRAIALSYPKCLQGISDEKAHFIISYNIEEN